MKYTLNIYQHLSLESFWTEHPYWSSSLHHHDYRKACLEMMTAPPIERPVDQPLIDALHADHRRWNAEPSVFRNIDALKKASTRVIITGQQPGFLGGPWYSPLKAFAVIKLANDLSQKWDGAVVPVFWLVNEDHDIQEANNIGYFDADNQLQKAQLPGYPNRNQHGVGELPIDKEEVQSFLAKFQTLTGKAPAEPGWLESLVESADTWGEFFTKMLLKLTGDSGLVVVRNDLPALKHAVKPFILDCVTKAQHLTQIVIDAGEKLEASGYTPQLGKKAEDCSFFLIDNDERQKLIMTEEFELNGQHLSQETLRQRFQNHPEDFSAGVIVNPPMMSAALPVVALLGGPGEAAYHLQLTDVYRELGLQQPIILPRPHLTLLTAKHLKFLDKHHVSLQQLYSEPEVVTSHIMKQFSKVADEGFWNRYNERITSILDDLETQLEEAGLNLTHLTKKTRNNLQNNIQWLKDKVRHVLEQQKDTPVQKMNEALDWIFPKSQIQERCLCTAFMIHLYGTEIAKAILSIQVTLEPGEHYFAQLQHQV